MIIYYYYYYGHCSFSYANPCPALQLERPRVRDGQPNLLKPNSSFAQWNSGPVQEAALSAPPPTPHASIRPEEIQASKAMKVESVSSENVNVTSPFQDAVRPTRGKLKRVLAIVNRH